MENDPIVQVRDHKSGVGSYVTGFLLSIILTIAAYVLVVNHVVTGGWLVTAIVGLALVQLCVQLLFFLHLGEEKRPRWNFVTLLFAGLVVLIIVFGSLWIMNNLNYNMMPGQMDVKKYMHDHEGL